MEFIQYEIRERVAVITLDRPDARNAQHPPLLRELDAAYDRAAEDDDVRVIALTGAGSDFCSGADLAELLS